MHNLDRILEEVALIKEQIAAAQARLAALESLLVQAAQQQSVQEQVKPAKLGQQSVQHAQAQPKEKVEAKEGELDFRGDVELALKIMELVDSKGELRISSIKFYLSFEHSLRVSEADIARVVKALESLGALKGTWTAPGIISRSAPIMDPWAGRGPEFSPVRRRLEELTRKR
jgi:small-conductance mechanosensitive channel